MKKSFFRLAVFVAAVCCAGSVYGESYESQSEKVYLNSRDVNVFDNQILVHLQGQWMSVPELYADETGIYLLRKVGLWFCKHCHWHNGDVPNCANCGRPRPE
jgi:hypothetical protein